MAVAEGDEGTVIVVCRRSHEGQQRAEAQVSSRRRVVASCLSAVACVAAVALLAGGDDSGALTRSGPGPTELTAGWMSKYQKASAKRGAQKMFLTAIDAAMAAAQDAAGNISPKLASQKPALKVVKSGQKLALAEPTETAEAQAPVEQPPGAVEAVGVAEPGVGGVPSEEAPVGSAEEAPQPSISSPIFPGETPGVTAETIDPEAAAQQPPLPEAASPPQPAYASNNGMVEEPMGNTAAPNFAQPSAQIEETMMPPGIPQTVQSVRAQVAPGQTFSSAVYPGAQIQVAVKSPAPATQTGDLCTLGKSQSPINVELNVEPAALPVLAWRLTTPGMIDGALAPVEVEGRGKWLRVVDAGLAMVVKGLDYQLQSLIVHAPSEHTVMGRRYDMELQFLHTVAVGEEVRYLIVSAFVEKAEPAASAPSLNGLAAKVAKMEDLETGAISINIRDLAMEVLGQTELVAPTATNAENYFTYTGSLTQSPCTEGVTWVVLKNPLQASAVDIEMMSAALPQTNRPLQAVGHRVIQDRHVLG